jgi:glycosyltransferase involved in cell wall biosynthesis
VASVDVIMPCYNYGRFLSACVASVLSQQVSDLRVLSIDDASQDGSLEVARSLQAADPRIDVIVHEQNRGHIATYNEGIEWVHADTACCCCRRMTCWLPEALSRAAGVLAGHPAVGFV